MGFECACASLVFPHGPALVRVFPSGGPLSGRSRKSVALACPRVPPRSASAPRRLVITGGLFSQGGITRGGALDVTAETHAAKGHCRLLFTSAQCRAEH